jgi:hypothetical protein
MLHTEQFRERKARTHERVADDARIASDNLGALLEVSGGGGELGRASSRRCPLCNADPGKPCVGDKGSPIKAFHRERAGQRELEARAVWHTRRANGLRDRPKNLRGCGGKMIATICSCGNRGKARPQGCGLYRLCASCSITESRRRRAKFGRARARVLLDAVRAVPGRGALAGEAAKYRAGGRYTDKMITLTIPHFDGHALFEQALDLDGQGDARDDARALAIRERVLAHGSSSIPARVAALFAAWPAFARRMKRAMKARGRGDELFTRWDRFFEWTPGADGEGHPHFHVWAFTPYLCFGEVAEWWTASVREVGVPVRTRETEYCTTCKRTHTIGAKTWVQRLGDFDARAVRELIAGGKAIELSAFRSMNVGPTAVTYAAGWSIADVSEQVTPEVEAELKCAIEGRRISQGSRGLYSDDAKPACPCCGPIGSRVIVAWSADDIAQTDKWNAGVKKTRQERAGPHDHDEQRDRYAG